MRECTFVVLALILLLSGCGGVDRCELAADATRSLLERCSVRFGEEDGPALECTERLADIQECKYFCYEDATCTEILDVTPTGQDHFNECILACGK